MANNQNKTARASLFGGLSGGVFFFGLAIAFVSGHFFPVFLATLAVTSLVGSLASANPQGIYGGFQGFVFLLGLAVLASTGWWWPGILVLLGISAILGSLNVPSVAGLLGLGLLTRTNRQPQEAYQHLSALSGRVSTNNTTGDISRGWAAAVPAACATINL